MNSQHTRLRRTASQGEGKPEDFSTCRSRERPPASSDTAIQVKELRTGQRLA